MFVGCCWCLINCSIQLVENHARDYTGGVRWGRGARWLQWSGGRVMGRLSRRTHLTISGMDRCVNPLVPKPRNRNIFMKPTICSRFFCAPNHGFEVFLSIWLLSYWELGGQFIASWARRGTGFFACTSGIFVTPALKLMKLELRN